MENNYTWAQKGTRTVTVRKADSSHRCSVLLCTNMTGSLKMEPFLVFKGAKTRGGRIIGELQAKEGYPTELGMTVQNRAWLDQETFVDWVSDYWKPFVESNGIEISYMILDESTVHLTQSVKDALIACGTEFDYIPGGYTSRVQPLDVGINKPFKNNIRNQFEDWMYANPRGTKIKRTNVAWFIKNSWDMIGIQTIKNSWRKAGFTAIDDRPEGIPELVGQQTDDDDLETESVLSDVSMGENGWNVEDDGDWDEHLPEVN
jgi:hypothetical protein